MRRRRHKRRHMEISGELPRLSPRRAEQAPNERRLWPRAYHRERTQPTWLSETDESSDALPCYPSRSRYLPPLFAQLYFAAGKSENDHRGKRRDAGLYRRTVSVRG